LPRSGLALTHGYLSREVRLHTVFFSARAMMLIAVDEYRHRTAGSYLDATSVALCCLPFHVAVDTATWAYGTPGVSSVRGNHSPPSDALRNPLRDFVRPFLSGAQFVNNHALLFGGPSRQGIAFAWLAWSQLNAFLMTLRRKQLISEDGLALSYTMLTVCVTVACLGLATGPMASMFAGTTLMLLRTRGCNKYGLWLGILWVSQVWTTRI